MRFDICICKQFISMARGSEAATGGGMQLQHDRHTRGNEEGRHGREEEGKGRDKIYMTFYPVTRNRTRDHLIAAAFYSQMLYQLSYDRR